MDSLNKERAEAFLKEYKELVDKHKVDFVTYPVYMPDGQGGFKTMIQSTPVDTSATYVKSPFIPGDNK